MEIEYDPAKSEKNKQDRDLPFDLTAKFEWETASVIWCLPLVMNLFAL